MSKRDDGKIWYGAGIDNTQLRNDARKTTQILGGIGNSAQAEGARIDSMMTTMGKGLIAIGGITALTALGKQILDTTAKFEKFGIILRNTLGDVKGDAALVMIAKFAATTPFQLDEVTAAFIKMANQGFTPTWDELTKLGDVASATGKSFDQLTEAILDAQTGQFERLKEFGIKASAGNGKVTFSFKEQQTTVDMTNSAIRAYVLSLGDLKGVQGANAKISESLTGKMSNLEDQLAALYNTIGKGNSGILYTGVNSVAYLIENYESIGKILLALVATYGTYRAALILATATSKGYTIAELLQYKALVMAEFAQKLLNKTMLKNPYVLAATLIMGVVSALWIYTNASDDAAESQGRLDDVASETQKNISYEVGKLEDLKEILNDSSKSYKIRMAALKDIQTIVPEYHASLTTEGILINNNSDALDAYVKKLELAASQQVLSSKLAEANVTKSEYIDGLGKDKYRYLATKNALAFDQSGTLTVERAAYDNNLTAVAFHAIEGKIDELNKVTDLYEGELKAVTEEMLAVKTVVVTPPPLANETAAQKRIADAKDRAKLKEDADKTALTLTNKAQQDKITAMADGDLKEIEQMKLDHKVKMDEIAAQQVELLAMYQELSDKEYLAKGGKDGKGGKGANPTKVSLSVEQTGVFALMNDSENAAFKVKQDAQFNQMLKDFATFTEKRNKIITDGANTIKAFNDKNVGGIYDGNIAEVKTKTDELLKALDSEYANKSTSYQNFVERLAKMKLAELSALLSTTKQLLGGGELSDEETAILRQEILALQEKIRELTNKPTSTDKKETIKSLNEINEAAKNIIDSFEGLDTTSKAVLNGMVTIGTSVVSVMETLDGVTKATFAAMTVAEQASVVLAIASAVLMVYNAIKQTVDSIISGIDELAEKRRETEQARFLGELQYLESLRGEYEWVQRIGESRLSYFKREGLELANQAKANEGDQASLFGKLQGSTYTGTKKGWHKEEGMGGYGYGKYEGDVSLAGKTYEDIALLSAKGLLSKDAEAYFQALEKAKAEGLDIQQMQLEYLEKLRESSTGTTYDSVVSGIIDGFKAGKRTAADFADTFGNLMQGAIVSAMSNSMNEKMRKWYEDFATFASDGLTEAEIAELRAEYNKLIADGVAEADAYEKVTGQSITDGASRVSASKGIATASQESVDENNGRLTTIQGHTFSLANDMKGLVVITQSVLNHVANIDTTTMEMRDDMKAVKAGISDLNTKGITLKR